MSAKTADELLARATAKLKAEAAAAPEAADEQKSFKALLGQLAGEVQDVHGRYLAGRLVVPSTPDPPKK